MDPAPLALLHSRASTIIIATSAFPAAPVVEQGPSRLREIDGLPWPRRLSRRERRLRTAAAQAAASASRDRPQPPDPVRRPVPARRPPAPA